MNKNYTLTHPRCSRRAFFILFVFVFCWCGSYGQTPEWIWARSAPNNVSGYGEGWSIATDILNNVYVTGEYQDTITFGSYVLTTTVNYTAYLTKYDLSGNILWAESAVNSATG